MTRLRQNGALDISRVFPLGSHDMRVIIGEQVYAEALDDETVLLELISGQYYGLDAVGSRLWQLLSELKSTEAVVEAAMQEFDVSSEELTRDLEELVRELQARHLLTIVS